MQEITLVSDTLKEDILRGMSASSRFIPSKYFYDDNGSKIFKKIMRMPEYYLTDCEYEIFERERENILNKIRLDGEDFNLIELGAGDGLKTSLLIEHFVNSGVDLKYIPIDISEQAIYLLVEEMKIKFPSLKISEQIGDYFEIMRNLNTCNQCRKVALFLGSNIGNYSHRESLIFFNQLSSLMNEGDMALIGFDLVKDPDLILRAYDDPGGHTRNFNLNLLVRLNRELGANFDIEKFSHYPIYDPIEKTAKSYLISKENQEVHFEELGQTFLFKKWETILTEMSRKFTEDDIAEMAYATGYMVKRNFSDRKSYYIIVCG